MDLVFEHRLAESQYRVRRVPSGPACQSEEALSNPLGKCGAQHVSTGKLRQAREAREAREASKVRQQLVELDRLGLGRQQPKPRSEQRRWRERRLSDSVSAAEMVENSVRDAGVDSCWAQIHVLESWTSALVS